MTGGVFKSVVGGGVEEGLVGSGMGVGLALLRGVCAS